jgi:SH3 domain protein
MNGRVTRFDQRLLRLLAHRSCVQVSLLGLAAMICSVSADTVYIHDMLYVPLRAKPESEANAVTKSLASGTALELLVRAENSDFVMVRYRDSNGESTEGYIHQQYLTKTPVAAARFEAMNEENQALKDQVRQLESDYATLDQALASQAQQYTEASDALMLAQVETERMRKLSQSASALDADRTRLEQQNALLVEEITDLRSLESKKQAEIQQQWYLIGVGSALGMALIGFLLGRRIYHRRYSGGWS